MQNNITKYIECMIQEGTRIATIAGITIKIVWIGKTIQSITQRESKAGRRQCGYYSTWHSKFIWYNKDGEEVRKTLKARNNTSQYDINESVKPSMLELIVTLCK